jgi:hypothetical protein
VDISDARSGQLRMRIFLPQQLMTDVDALHGEFLTIDENGQRLFAITSLDGSPQNAALTVVQLASVPLAIGSISTPTISAAGGTTLTIRGSGFQAGIKVAVGGKPTMATLVDMNTLTVVSPAVPIGPAAVNANQRERRDCYSRRCGHRQLVTNFSRLVSSKLTTTFTHSIFGA